MNWKLEEIAELVEGRLCDVSGEETIESVSTDSRRVVPHGALFVALRGPSFDGHAFAEEAVESGAVAALVEKGRLSGIPRVEVDDTLAALQQIAAGWRREYDGRVVGITGSHGKTIVKEMAASILGRSHTLHRSPGSYNSQVGVALALLGIEAEHEFALIEAGVSEQGEMERLEPMIAPDIGLVTSIGEAHLAGLGGSLTAIAREKLQLFCELDGPLLFPAAALEHLDVELPVDSILFHVEPDGPVEGYAAERVERDGSGFRFEIVTRDGERFPARIATPGRYNVSNALAAAALALELGASTSDVAAGLAGWEAAPMRLEMHTTQSGITLLNDAYVSDPTSARTALEALEFYAGPHRKVAILGDMRELGDLAERAHRELGAFAADAGVDVLLAVGRHSEAMVTGARDKGVRADSSTAFSTLEEASAVLESLLEPGDFVLFKGSRAIGLERLASALVESVAPERLEVDLDAICSNVRALRAEMNGDIEIMAVVKSFAYGNDSTRVSQTLVREGVSWLAVAYPDEAIPLRRRGIDVPILVTNVMPGEADKFPKYRLTALVSDRPAVEALSRAAAIRGVDVPIHLEVDTGMHRLGVRSTEVVDLADFVAASDGVWLQGVMTHLAAADDEGEDDFTRGQLQRFEEALGALAVAGHDLEVVHAANTAGAWRFPEARYDMVRVGLGLYGIAPSTTVSREAELVPALRFTSRVLQVSDVESGETVGYGRTWRAERPSRIATIAVGYNDGFPRFMSNGGEVLVAGRRCPVIGNVCMDATMVDVTDLESVGVGDEVVLFGVQGEERIDVDELAARGGTISYEILTGISPRVRRIFRRGPT